MNLINKKVKIIKSSNKTLEGIEGLIIDETKNTLLIESDKIRKVLKKEVKLKINTQNRMIVIDGNDLIGRPEKRLKDKKKVKSRW